jgi:hypothetical protein
MTDVRILLATAVLLLAPLPILAQAPAPAGRTVADAEPTVMAVWVETDVNFMYKGLTSYYTCDGIGAKVGAILKYIGARPGFKVQVRGCINDAGRSLNQLPVEPAPWVHIHAALPRPATPELLAELAKPDAKKELVARATGKGASTAEATAQFPARWQEVRLLGTQLGPVQLGDCELVDAMRRDVFEKLGAKIIDDQMSCVPKQVTPGSVRLTLEVLQPVPTQ